MSDRKHGGMLEASIRLGKGELDLSIKSLAGDHVPPHALLMSAVAGLLQQLRSMTPDPRAHVLIDDLLASVDGLMVKSGLGMAMKKQ